MELTTHGFKITTHEDCLIIGSIDRGDSIVITVHEVDLFIASLKKAKTEIEKTMEAK